MQNINVCFKRKYHNRKKKKKKPYKKGVNYKQKKLNI